MFLEGNRLNVDKDSEDIFAKEAAETQKNSANRIDTNPDNVEQGLAKLVLTLVELIRRLLENQAIRRIENGSLTEDEIEEMGTTFIKLDEKMEELKEVFNLKGEDLNLDLGPLGNLM